MVTGIMEEAKFAKIQEAIHGAARRIRDIVLERVDEVRDQFPAMGFATEPDHWCSSDEFGDHQVYKVGDFPGIPLTSMNRRPYMVVLMLDGIKKCPIADAVRWNLCQYHPRLVGAVMSDSLWVQYGEYALSILYPRHPRPLAIKGREKEGMAGIGQEFCRYCGHVDLAIKFRFTNKCPGCGDTSWLAQYGVDAE